MTAQYIANLKARFERLDKPTEEDFSDFLDTVCTVLGENWPEVLPAASAARLTNLPYDDPLPPLDGGSLTNVHPSVWYQFPVTPTWASTTTFLLEGNWEDLLNQAIRLRIRYVGSSVEQTQTLVSAAYNSVSNSTTVGVATTMLSTQIESVSMSIVPVWTDFPVTDFDVGTLGALELLRANAAGTAMEGVAQAALGVTGFGPGSATASQLLRVNAGATAPEGIDQADLGVTGFGPGSATAGQFLRVNAGATAPEGVDAPAAVADLGQTISGSYTQAEVQAISDKVDELLGTLRTAGFLAT